MSLPYGSGRRDGSIQVLSLGESDLDQTLRRLFGWQRDDGSVGEGLIAKAKGSALFVDEAHYPPDRPGARAALLRTLEADTYYPVGSDEPHSVDNVLWIFASSRTLAGRDSIGKLKPVDFWTRMSHVIQVRHPLDGNALKKEADTNDVGKYQRAGLQYLFRFFWISRLEEYFGQRIVQIPPVSDDSDQSSDQIVVNRKLRRLLKEQDMKGMERAFATCLIRKVRPKPLHEISVRGLRGMVGQLVSRAIQAIEESEQAKLVKLVTDEMPEVFKQMRQVASLALETRDHRADFTVEIIET